ncbi:hypothetical protein DESC_180084 [Desulfosarcina cetonica]|nr:hypothetical protein DESC_180084 [Desulfosarcina cetonica]
MFFPQGRLTPCPFPFRCVSVDNFEDQIDTPHRIVSTIIVFQNAGYILPNTLTPFHKIHNTQLLFV